MNDVYFVNCLLACTLAFIVGYWRGKKVGFHAAAGMFANAMVLKLPKEENNHEA